MGKLQIRLEGERIGEAQAPGAGKLAALRRRTQAAHIHGIAAAHRFGADRHAGLRQRAAHALLVGSEIELERPRELGRAQRRAQAAQVEPARAQRAAKALRAELAAAFEQPAARELDAQLFQHGAREVLACNARAQSGERQPALVERSRGGVRNVDAALQATVAAACIEVQCERGMRQVGLQAREIDRRGARFERHDVLRPEGLERRLHLGGRLGLAQAEPQLQPLERAAEPDGCAEREVLVLELEAALGRHAGGQGGAHRDMGEAHPAQRIDCLGARHAQVLDVHLAEAHPEGQERGASGAGAALGDRDVERSDVQRLEHQAPAERRREMRMRADVARLDPGAVGLVAHALDQHRGGERAARARDLQVRAGGALGVRDRPAQAGLGAEEPDDADGHGAGERAEKRGRADEDAARAQKPYPTEKCSRQSLVRAP